MLILESAGIVRPERLQGVSRIQEVLAGDLGWKAPVFIQNRTQPGVENGPHDERMVRLGDWKLIVRRFNRPRVPRRDELLNLSSDPLEQTNLIALPEHQEKLEELAAMLLAWGRKVDDSVAVQLGLRYAPNE